MVKSARRPILLKTWWCGVVFTCLFMGVTLFSLAWHEWPDEGQPLFNKIRRFSPDATIGEPLWVARSGLHRLDVDAGAFRTGFRPSDSAAHDR